jgi:carbon storage regulator
MLIISRKKDQKIIVADDIEITILEVGRNRVRFGIKAPKDIPIHTRLKTSPVPEEKPPQSSDGTEPSREKASLQAVPATMSLSKTT